MPGQAPQTPQAAPSSPLPTFMLHTPAVDFVENRMSEYHPAFDTSGLRYSPTRSSFVAIAPGQPTLAPLPTPPAPPQARPTPGSINEMSFWEKVFPEAMSRLKQTPLPYKGPYEPEWGIRHLTVWRDVQAKLDMARRDYEFHNNQQQVGSIRRKMRSAMDKAGAPLQLGRKFIPNMDLTSPVTGVIDLLLAAYTQAAEVRETVNSGFDDLVNCFGSIEVYLKWFPDDQNVLEASVELILAVFRAVEEAVSFYTSAQAKRAGSAILTGEEYQKKLLGSLQDIKKRAEALEHHVGTSFQHRVLFDGNETRKAHATLRQDNWATHQALGVLMQQEATRQAELAWALRLLNQTVSMLTDHERNWPPHLSRPTTPNLLPSSFTPPPNPIPMWSTRELWTALHTPHLDEHDMSYILGPLSSSLFLSDRGRAEQLLSTPLFHSWLVAPRSAKLLVHGDFDRGEGGAAAAVVDGVSPLSVLCATVVKALQLGSSGGLAGVKRVMVSLVFFCGCHLKGKGDELYGSEVMIRSLLAQLLRQFPVGEVQPDLGMIGMVVEEAGTEELCRLFVYLVRQLPPEMTVYCLIDGINEYETEEYLHGMDTVVLALLGLVDEGDGRQDGRVKFKLLLMSPQPTVEVRQVFDDVPEALLHMAQLPMLDEGLNSARIQEQLEAARGDWEQGRL